MATKWDALWDDEDWWKKQSRTALYVIYRDIQNEEDKLKFRNKMMLSSVDADKSIWTAYDLLSFVQVAEEAGFQYTTDVDETKDIRREDIEALAVTRLQALEKNSEKNLSYYLRAKALKEVISKTTSSDDNDRDILKTSIYTDTKKIEEQLPQTEATLEQTLEFYDANDSGALEGISDEVKQAFLKKIEQTFGWNLVNAEQVKANDAHLNNNINLSVKINDDAGNEIINPIYAECVDIPLSFDYPEGISDEKKQQLAHLYKSQLLANAAQRATMELMKNPKLISEAQTKEDLVAKFADVVKQKYQYSVVMAALVSDEDLGKKIKFDSKTMQLVADDTNDADIQNILVKLKNNETQLNPDVIAIDTTALKWEIENAENIMKTKHIDVDALPFWKKVSGAVLGGWNHITKRGGWKNLSVNAVANVVAYTLATGAIGYGAAAVVAAGASASAVIALAGGYALYAGWSYVSAKKMPTINKLISEANEQKLSFKDTMKYAWKNFSRARKEKEAEAEFKSRSNFRVGEGFIGGAATTAGAFLGNPWIKGIISAAGKATLLIKSGFNLKKDRKKFRENVTLDNYNKMKTSENYVTQDAVSLTAVLAGRIIAQNLFGDATTSNGQERQVVTEVKKDQLDNLELKKQPLYNLLVKGQQPDSLVIKGQQPDSLEIKGQQPDSLEIKGQQPDSLVIKGQQPDSLEIKGQQLEGSAEGASNPTSTGETYNGYPLNDNGPYSLNEVNYADYTHIKPYNQEMGISLRSYKTLFRIYGAKELDRMYASLSREGVMDNFKDMGLTKEQLLVRFRGLDATTERVGADGFSIQGATRYHHEEAMTYLNKLFGPCGDQITSEQYAVIKQSLAVMDNQGGYHGEGFVPTSSEHIRAHGYNTSGTKGCGEGELNQFKIGDRIKTQEPVVDIKPLPEKVVANVGDAEILSAQDEVTVAKNTEVKIDMNDQYSKFKASYDPRGGDGSVDMKSIEGEYDYSLNDLENGTIGIWQDKDKSIISYGTDSPETREIAYHAPVDASPVIEKLPDVPTSTETVDGVTTMTYSFESGKTVKVVLDPLQEGTEARTGHFLINGKEYIIDEKSSELLANKMSMPKDDGITYTSTDGVEQNVSQHLEDNVTKLDKGVEKLNNRIKEIAEQLNGAREGSDSGKITTETQVNNVTLTPEQVSEIRANGSFVCEKIEDGKAVMRVTGIEGVDLITVQAPTHVDMAGASDPAVNVNGNVYTATITTKEGQNLVVSIDNNIDPVTNLPKGTNVTLDGKQVVLDSKTTTAVEASVEKAFDENKTPVDVKMHTPFTEKMVKAAEAWKNVGEKGTGMNSTLRYHVAEKGTTH